MSQVKTLEQVRLKLQEMNLGIKADKILKSIKFVGIKEEIKSVGPCCQATNMNGQPCKTRASCGKYCRRHKI